jgi:hypothetical protein
VRAQGAPRGNLEHPRWGTTRRRRQDGPRRTGKSMDGQKGRDANGKPHGSDLFSRWTAAAWRGQSPATPLAATRSDRACVTFVAHSNLTTAIVTSTAERGSKTSNHVARCSQSRKLCSWLDDVGRSDRQNVTRAPALAKPTYG